jgi:hypothetical protein
MKKRKLGLALVVLAMVSVARDASAVESDSGEAAVLIGGFGVVDIGLVSADLISGAQREWLPRGYGVFETVAGGAQFAICLDLALTALPGNTDSGVWKYGAAFGAILMTHGLVTLLGPRSHTEAPTPPAPFVVAPVALSDVARDAVPGLAVLGRF